MPYLLLLPLIFGLFSLTSANSITLSLSPRSYGGYSVSLDFGTPPQTLNFLMDTGSSLVWFPCTKKYSCSSCDSHVDPPVFVPESSSSSRIVGCRTPKCNRVFPDVRCMQCEKNSTTTCCECCPPYDIKYVTGSTTGRFMSETLTFPTFQVDDFFAGCSDSSTNQPEGIVGFGRGWESLPSQMNLTSFSYCLVSHSFDNNNTVSSDLVLNSVTGGDNIQYTPFIENANISSIPKYLEYYYVGLQKITVGPIDVKVSDRYLELDTTGNGGTIVDSGTPFTIMEEAVFKLVADELLKQAGKNYKRDKNAEKKTGFGLCLSGQESLSDLPKLSFHFGGGGIMVQSFHNYILSVENSVICTSMLSIATAPGESWQGPAVILGNNMQRNFYMEYDLKNNRLGFREQECQKVN